MAVGRFLLAPAAPADVARFRIVPMTTPAARFWYWRLAVIVGWVAFGRVLVDDAALFGISLETRELLAYGLGLVLLAHRGRSRMARAAFGRRCRRGESAEARHRRHARAAGLSLYFVVLWLSWVIGAMTLFWMRRPHRRLAGGRSGVTERSVNHILRPPGHEEAQRRPRQRRGCLP